jgi:hypothetical protein
VTVVAMATAGVGGDVEKGGAGGVPESIGRM